MLWQLPSSPLTYLCIIHHPPRSSPTPSTHTHLLSHSQLPNHPAVRLWWVRDGGTQPSSSTGARTALHSQIHCSHPGWHHLTPAVRVWCSLKEFNRCPCEPQKARSAPHLTCQGLTHPQTFKTTPWGAHTVDLQEKGAQAQRPWATSPALLKWNMSY